MGGNRAAFWILGLGLGVSALLAVISVAANRDDTEAGSSDAVVIESMTAADGAATPVPRERIVVAATSFLEPVGTVTYSPDNTIDDDPATAWNSDAGSTDGRGETLTYRFPEPVDLQIIQFRNGYTKTPEIFAANHRIADVRVITDSGSRLLTLQDTGELQQVAFDFGYTSKVVLEVVEIYAGEGFDNPELTADLALSEITFIAVQR